VVPLGRIAFTWKAHQVEERTRVEMLFEPVEEGGTRLTISEAGWKRDAAGIASSHEHCAGWQHMLLCLKARLVHRIDLRV